MSVLQVVKTCEATCDLPGVLRQSRQHRCIGAGTAAGGYASPAIFVAGLRPAVVVGAAVLGAGALAAHAVPGLRRRSGLAGDVAEVPAATPPVASAA